MLLFEKLRCVTPVFRDLTESDLTAPCLQTYVMSPAVTEQIVTQSRRLAGFSRFKMAKIDPVSPFYPNF